MTGVPCSKYTLLEEETDNSNDLLNTNSSRLREAASSTLQSSNIGKY